MGDHLLQRTGRTGLGGTGSPAQGVFGVSCKAGLLRSGLEGERVGGWASCAALCCAVLCCALLCCGVCCDVLCAVLC